MFDGRDLAGAERLINEWRGPIEERTARSRELETRLAQLSQTVRSPDGSSASPGSSGSSGAEDASAGTDTSGVRGG